MTHTRLCFIVRRVLCAVLLYLATATAATAASADAKPGAGLIEPPPLDAAIVEMMKTNSLGAIEGRIYFVEQWEIAPIQKSQVFLSMLGQAGTDDQRKLAHAAVQHVPHTNYALIRRHLLDSNLPRVVLSVFMTDTLKRPYQIKLPVILSLAQITAHPMQAEAQELLRGYLGRDHGTNWLKWEETMAEWLAAR